MARHLTNVDASGKQTHARYRSAVETAARETGLPVYYRGWARDRWGERDFSSGAIFTDTAPGKSLSAFWRAYEQAMGEVVAPSPTQTEGR